MSLLHAERGAALPVDEAPLADLGVHRLEIPVPFAEAGGPANVYVLEGQGGALTLFDTGVGTEEGLEALRSQARAKGLELSKVERIIISHGHVDHFGNAQLLAQETGAQVLVHPWDFAKLVESARWYQQLVDHQAYFERALGVPREVVEQMQERSRRGREYAKPVEKHRVGTLADGDRFSFRALELEVKHCPGHTPGLVCLWSEKERLLFADDHVLARVSPNPLLDLSRGTGPEKFRALSAYLESARAVRELDVNVVLPGHGPAFTGHRPLLDGLFGFYAKRQQRIVEHLRAHGPQSVYALVPMVFARPEPSRLYLMLSEVLGNLEVLEEAGEVRCSGGAWEVVSPAD